MREYRKTASVLVNKIAYIDSVTLQKDGLLRVLGMFLKTYILPEKLLLNCKSWARSILLFWQMHF